MENRKGNPFFLLPEMPKGLTHKGWIDNNKIEKKGGKNDGNICRWI